MPGHPANSGETGGKGLLASIPFEQLETLMNNRTTKVQKKTAYKILLRYFKDT